MKINIPSSQGGLNLKDSLDVMEPRYAIQMDNVIPDTNRDVVRGGCRKVSSNPAKTFISFDGATPSSLIVANEGVLSKVNDDGTFTEVAKGFSSDNWQSVHFTDASGRVNMIAVNGADKVQRFYNDESGVLTHEEAFEVEGLHSPAVFKNRLYFAQGMNVKYAGVDSIDGEIKDFPVGAIFASGGEICALADWTQDAGEGMDDLFVILTDKGEVAVYSGTSPEATDWSLTGVFRISKPIGKNCLIKYGGDLVVITEGGYFPLSEVLSQDRANSVPVSDKINPIVEGKDFNARWGVYYYPRGGWIFVNAPSKDTGYSHEQHVLNIKTGGWCRFAGWDAQDFCVFDDNLYFCNENGVYLADTGNTDDGKKITYYLQKAYSSLGVESIKQVVMLKERVNAKGNYNAATRLGVDFALQDESTKLFRVGNTQTYWDSAIWDVSFWTNEARITQTKSTIFSKYGDFISVGVLGQTADALEFYSIQAKLKVGNGEVW